MFHEANTRKYYLIRDERGRVIRGREGERERYRRLREAENKRDVFRVRAPSCQGDDVESSCVLWDCDILYLTPPWFLSYEICISMWFHIFIVECAIQKF